MGMEKGYLNHLYNLDAQASGMLGSFDANNQYVIENDIIKELIMSNKLITSYENDTITAVATVGEYKLDFVVYIQHGENNLKRVGLFVIEKCKLEFASNVKTLVDSYVAENTPDFYIDLKKRYHLYAVDESEGIDMKNSNLTKIIGKKSGNVNRYKVFIPLMYDADKEYVKKMLSVIKSSGKYGPDFIIKLKETIEANKLQKNSPTYWRDVKIILDKMLLQALPIFSKDVLAKMQGIQGVYLDVLSKTKEPVPEEPSKPKKSKPSALKVEPPKIPKIDYSVYTPSKDATTTAKVGVRETVETTIVKDAKGRVISEETTVTTELFGTVKTAEREKGHRAKSDDGRSA